MDKLNKREKANFISIFDFSTLYTELLYYKLLIVLNNLADFCFGRGENKCITISGYGACWGKDIKGNQISLKRK